VAAPHLRLRLCRRQRVLLRAHLCRYRLLSPRGPNGTPHGTPHGTPCAPRPTRTVATHCTLSTPPAPAPAPAPATAPPSAAPSRPHPLTRRTQAGRQLAKLPRYQKVVRRRGWLGFEVGKVGILLQVLGPARCRSPCQIKPFNSRNGGSVQHTSRCRQRGVQYIPGPARNGIAESSKMGPRKLSPRSLTASRDA